MSEQQRQLSNSRKRRCIEEYPPDLKRQTIYHSTTKSHSSLEFWDSLSKIWLTKYALRELNRRNTKPLARSPVQQPFIQNFLTEVKKPCKPTQSTDELLHSYPLKIVKDIKLFARHGGPYLTDLRGVRIIGWLIIL
jgi:hypothetical protein